MTDAVEVVLELYVAGGSLNSAQAIENLRRICEERLSGRYSLEVIDVLEDPQAAEAANILATPTLIRRLPQPVHLLVGDLSRTQQVLQGLGLPQRTTRDARTTTTTTPDQE